MSLIIEPSGLTLANERGWMRDAKTRAYVEDVLVSALVIEHRLRIKDRMYLAAADIPRGASITPWRLPLNLSIEQLRPLAALG